MAVQKQDDQHKHTFSNYVRIQDVVQKTCLWRLTKSGERGLGISVLAARHDDDDDDDSYCKLYKKNYFYLFCELNYHDKKIRRTPTHDIRERWTAVSTLLGLISSVCRNLHRWRSNQRPKIALPKLYNWDTSSYRTEVTPNQLIIVIARPNNLNVSCKLHPYSFQRTRSPPGSRLLKKLGNSIHNINFST